MDDKNLAAKSSKDFILGGPVGGGESGKMRTSERHKEKEVKRDSRMLGRGGTAVVAAPSSSPPGAGSGGKRPAEDSGGGAEVRRAWRHRKGRWMYVVIKDDVKNTERKKDASSRVGCQTERDAESGPSSEAAPLAPEMVHTNSHGDDVQGEQVDESEKDSAEGGAAGCQSEEGVKKKMRRRPRGRLTMPRKRGMKAVESPINSCQSNEEGKKGDEDNASEGAEDASRGRAGAGSSGRPAVSSYLKQDGAGDGRPSFKREAPGDEHDAPEMAPQQGTQKGDGVRDLRKMLHGLVRRIHVAAFTCP